MLSPKSNNSENIVDIVDTTDSEHSDDKKKESIQSNELGNNVSIPICRKCGLVVGEDCKCWERQLETCQGWSQINQQKLTWLQLRLKYNYEISKFFFYTLKTKENRWSWLMIVLSSLTSTLSLLNNVENEPFIHFYLTVKIILVMFALCITLIAAWIKKQQYVERINDIDRYVQRIKLLIEKVDMECVLLPWDRTPYDEFKKRYYSQICECLTCPSINPSEFKKVVYQISKYHPEIITSGHCDEQKLWPWYGYDFANINLERTVIRPLTTFGKLIIDSYESQLWYNRLFNFFLCNKHDMSELKACEIAENLEEMDFYPEPQSMHHRRTDPVVRVA
uniref:Uncharacterized protein n=1 Tax=viral metagenome TaxID=1070528 RepID=A0A6C0JEI6_9ZZZZ